MTYPTTLAAAVNDRLRSRLKRDFAQLTEGLPEFITAEIRTRIDDTNNDVHQSLFVYFNLLGLNHLNQYLLNCQQPIMVNIQEWVQNSKEPLKTSYTAAIKDKDSPTSQQLYRHLRNDGLGVGVAVFMAEINEFFATSKPTNYGDTLLQYELLVDYAGKLQFEIPQMLETSQLATSQKTANENWSGRFNTFLISEPVQKYVTTFLNTFAEIQRTIDCRYKANLESACELTLATTSGTDVARIKQHYESVRGNLKEQRDSYTDQSTATQLARYTYNVLMFAIAFMPLIARVISNKQQGITNNFTTLFGTASQRQAQRTIDKLDRDVRPMIAAY